MEDAATVEISRMQIWQWIRHGAQTSTGVTITRDLVTGMLAGETIRAFTDGSGADDWAVEAASDILRHSCLETAFPSFLTEYAYRSYLVGS